MSARLASLFSAALLVSVGCSANVDESVILLGLPGNEAELEQESTVVLGPFFPTAGAGNGITARHVFTVRNQSDNPITLTLTDKTCGCTRVRPNFERLEPRASGAITLETDLPASTGRQLQGVVFASSSGRPTKLRLNLDCYRYARLALLPADTAEVRVAPGTTEEFVTRVAAYQPAGEDPLKLLTETRGRGLSSTVRHLQERVLSGGIRETTAEIVTVADCPAMTNESDLVPERGTVVVRSGDEEVVRNVLWRPNTPIRVVPERLFASANMSKSIVRLRSKSPFRVASVRSDLPWLRGSALSNESASEQEVHVQASEDGSSEMSRRGVLVIETDHPDQTEVHVPVYMFRTAEAVLE